MVPLSSYLVVLSREGENGVAVAETVGNGRSVGGADVGVGVGVGEETAVHPITPNNKIIIESSHTPRIIM